MTVHDTHTPGRKAPAYKPTDWLPTSVKEVRARGWDELDVILFSGDAYIDHPSFGAAVIGRLLEAEGLRVAIVPQPNWKDDLRDFRKLGRPRLFFGVSGGAMDSMVNHYTANKRLRSDDAYTAGGKAGFRPDYVVTVYTRILKQLYPDTPVIIGGIEASLRRTTHYDYWSDSLKPSVLVESGADLLIYGMGDMHLDVTVAKLKARYGVSVALEKQKIAYREAIKKKVSVEGKHKKQSGGHGQYGHVKIEFSPSDTEGLTFTESIFGGSVPKNFHPAVQKGLEEAMKKGVLAGFPMIGLKANLFDGSYHDVDSSEMAFKMAASLAYKEGMKQANPVIMEPIVSMRVYVPDAMVGDVLGDFNKRRGRVLGINPDETKHGSTIVEAEVPQAEVLEYTVALRSMTQGRGRYDMQFVRYEEVPAPVAEKIIAENKANLEE